MAKDEELGAAPGQAGARVVLFSQRNIFRNVLFRCPHQEFENVICQVDAADMLAPSMDQRVRYQLAKRLAWHLPVALNPGLSQRGPQGHYDLFFAVCGSPVDLLTINTLGNFKDFAKVSICLIDELWVTQLAAYAHMLKLLRKFDYVMLYYSQSVAAVERAVGRPCVFLPPGIDAAAFCPYPAPPERVVDLYSIGRRSEGTHEALLKMVAGGRFFYLHDSIAGDRSINGPEHRALFANVAKRSRYFIVNPALIDRPSVRGDQSEIGNRYFEGAAAGTIMVGERPHNDEFEKLFDWPEAVMDLPYGSGDIGSIIEKLDRDPERQEKMRRNNVVNALRRHDWVYRWEEVLKVAGLEPGRGLLKRKQHLEQLAGAVTGTPGSRPDTRGNGRREGTESAGAYRVCGVGDGGNGRGLADRSLKKA